MNDFAKTLAFLVALGYARDVAEALAKAATHSTSVVYAKRKLPGLSEGYIDSAEEYLPVRRREGSMEEIIDRATCSQVAIRGKTRIVVLKLGRFYIGITKSHLVAPRHLIDLVSPALIRKSIREWSRYV